MASTSWTTALPGTVVAPGALVAPGGQQGPGGPGWQVGTGLGLNNSTTPPTLNLTVPVAIANGGTGAVSAATALSSLGALPTAGGSMTGPLIAYSGTGLAGVGLGIGDNSTGFYRTGNTVVLSVSGQLFAQWLGTTPSMMMGVPLNMAAQPITGASAITATGALTAGSATLTGRLTVNLNVTPIGSMPSLPTTTVAWMIAPDGTAPIMVMDGYGVGGPGYILHRTARGTAAAPTATQSGDVLSSDNAAGYTGSAFGTAGVIQCRAIENWTPAALGSEYVTYTVQAGTTNAQFRTSVRQGLMVLTSAGALPPGGDLGPGSINAAGVIQSANAVVSQLGGIASSGNNGGFTFYERDALSNYWIWYATGGQARLIRSGGPDLVTFDFAGNQGGINPTRGYLTKPGAGAATTAHVFNIDFTGSPQLWIDSTNFGTFAFTSDYRIKTDIEPLGSTWDRVKQLRPISYTIKDNEELLSVKDESEHWGFFAHELQETLIERASSGVKDAPGERQSPNPWVMLAAVVSALQEAQARIEALELQQP